MEKPLAQAAGLGWQGKHTNLVSREAGSWLFLGALFTDLAIEPDAAETDHCGQCRACLDACPTKAFPQPYLLDARRCISYLTIEHKGHIPAHSARGDRQPHLWLRRLPRGLPVEQIRASLARSEIAGARRSRRAAACLICSALDDAGFRALFSGSPVKRIGSARFTRNLLVAAGNSGDLSLLPLVELRLDDPSPLVRAMAVWALWRLAPQRAAALAARHRAREDDADVLAEWGRIEAPVEVMQ